MTPFNAIRDTGEREMVTQRILDCRRIVRGAVVALVCGWWLLASLAVGQEAAPGAAPATPAAKTVPASRKPRRQEAVPPTIYYLKYADARSTAQTLAKLVDARGLDARFVPETRLNAIFVQASPEVHKLVEQLLKELDVPAAPSGDQKDAKKNQELHVQIYRLKYADAGRLAEVVSEVYRDKPIRLGVDPHGDSIIVAAPAELQAQLGALIEQLDQTQEHGADRKYQYRVFGLVNAEARDVAKVITTVLGPGEKIAVDERTNSILAQGTQGTLLIIDAILTKLDEAADKDLKKYSAATTFQVRVVWVASELPPDQGAKPADDLKEVLGELAKIGVKELRQVGQAIVNTTPDGQFQVRCSPLLAGRPSDLEISGTLKMRQETPILNVQLSASQTEPAALGPPGRGRPTTKRLVDLGTAITAPLGHYVVLGVTPVEKMTSVFVIQVTAGQK
jgi:hypothetical protein